MVVYFKGVVYKGRSAWKGLNLFVFSKTYKKDVKKRKIKKKKFTLGFKDLGLNYYVYNGRVFKKTPIGYKAHGCKFGQFITTKKQGRSIHIKKVKKKKKK